DRRPASSDVGPCRFASGLNQHQGSAPPQRQPSRGIEQKSCLKPVNETSSLPPKWCGSSGIPRRRALLNLVCRLLLEKKKHKSINTRILKSYKLLISCIVTHCDSLKTA